MKRCVWKALSLQACLLAACTSEMSEPFGDRNDGWLELNFAVVETRADLDASGAGSFSEGDRIGLYIDNGSKVEFRTLTYTSGSWEPRLSRNDFGEGTLTLAAHYPVQTDPVDNFGNTTFSLSEEQSGEGFAASDLLFARKSLPAGENRADMLFSHALHRLRTEISGTEISEVKVRSRMKAAVNLLTGEVSASEEALGWITPHKNTDGSYEAVILPQRAETFRDDQGLLKISTPKKVITYQAPAEVDGTPLEEFRAGQQLTLKLSLKESVEPEEPDVPVISDWANKKVWVYGIEAPVWEETATEWIRLHPNTYSTYYLPWKPEYGWYDCNKTDPENDDKTAYADGNMCWAASVSNLLHWWFAQNKTYIDRYSTRYEGPSYEYPLPKKQESDIFQCFIDTFVNEGGYGEKGINWFINGDIPSVPARRNPNDGGYFKEVFGDVRLGKDVMGMGKEKFNNTIKDALANRKAIAISLAFSTGGHLETIWGAEFDENGDVSYIYMADNNDRDTFEKNKVGIGRFQIVYSSDTVFTGFLSGYIEDSTPVTIKGLTTIELGQEQWKAFFREHPEL